MLVHGNKFLFLSSNFVLKQDSSDCATSIDNVASHSVASCNVASHSVASYNVASHSVASHNVASHSGACIELIELER